MTAARRKQAILVAALCSPTSLRDSLPAVSEADPSSSTAVAVREGKRPRRERPKRPLSVTLVVLLAFGVAVYSLVYGVFDVLSGERHRMAVGAFRLAIGVGAVVACIGGLWLKSWAWTVFMTWAVGP